MTARWSFYGSSDDLVEYTGPDGDDEINFYSGVWTGILTDLASGGQVKITATYVGTWILGAGPVDDDVPMPDWPITIGPAPECQYSSLLTIDVPDGTVLHHDQGDDD